jgi:hypothetical protein
MNDHELEAILGEIHRGQALVEESELLHARVMAIPDQRPVAEGTTIRRTRVWSGIGVVMVAAAAALLVGIALSSPLVLNVDHDGMAPGGAGSPSASPIASDLLPPGFQGEIVEPGVVRVLNDGFRDLTWQGIEREDPARQFEVVADYERDLVLIASPAGAIEIGQPTRWSTDEGTSGLPMEWSTQAGTYRQGRQGNLRVSLLDGGERLLVARTYPVPLLDSEPAAEGQDGTVWRLVNRDTIAREDEAGWTELGPDDGVSLEIGTHPEFASLIRVAPDGSPWISMAGGSFHDIPGGRTDCNGIAHYDGHTTTTYLHDQGLCVSSFDISADGSVWLQAWTWMTTGDESFEPEPEIPELRTYLIPAADRRSEQASIRASQEDRSMGTKERALATIAAASMAAMATPAAGQSEPAMTTFSGTLGCGIAASTPDGHTAWSFRNTDLSDARLGGQHISHLAGYEHGDPDVDDGVGAYSGLWEVTNEEGSWVGEFSTFRFLPDSYSTLSIELDGQGAYDGLTAVMEADFLESCGWDLRGVIVDGELPPNPVPNG